MPSPVLLALVALLQTAPSTDEGVSAAGGQAAVQASAAASVPVPSMADAPSSPAADPSVVRQVVFGDGKRRGMYRYMTAGPYYPERAAVLGVSGSVVMDCVLAERDVLGKCAIVSEEPAGQAFRDAALRMARDRALRLKLGDPADDPGVGARVRVSVPFEFYGDRRP